MPEDSDQPPKKHRFKKKPTGDEQDSPGSSPRGHKDPQNRHPADKPGKDPRKKPTPGHTPENRSDAHPDDNHPSDKEKDKQPHLNSESEDPEHVPKIP